jgi:hypothetical protein
MKKVKTDLLSEVGQVRMECAGVNSFVNQVGDREVISTVIPS